MFLFLTIFSYLIGKLIHTKLSSIPSLIVAIFVAVGLLDAFNFSYGQYYEILKPFFQNLTGISLVALALPLANLPTHHARAMLKHIPIIIASSVIGALLPATIAWLITKNTDITLAFTTRAITTPFAIAVSEILNSNTHLAVFIVIFSGIIGAAILPLILKKCTNDKVYGLIMGLTAHAIGTAQSWRKSVEAGQYATLGMILNGLITALWLPFIVKIIKMTF